MQIGACRRPIAKNKENRHTRNGGKNECCPNNIVRHGNAKLLLEQLYQKRRVFYAIRSVPQLSHVSHGPSAHVCGVPLSQRFFVPIVSHTRCGTRKLLFLIRLRPFLRSVPRVLKKCATLCHSRRNFCK